MKRITVDQSRAERGSPPSSGGGTSRSGGSPTGTPTTPSRSPSPTTRRTGRRGVKRNPIDAAFRIHEGRLLAGTLTWSATTGSGTTARRDQPLVLAGTYRCTWLPLLHSRRHRPHRTPSLPRHSRGTTCHNADVGQGVGPVPVPGRAGAGEPTGQSVHEPSRFLPTVDTYASPDGLWSAPLAWCGPQRAAEVSRWDP